MRTIFITAVVVVLLIGAAYVAGYWPERNRRLQAETEATTLREQLAGSSARVRTAALLGQVLTVKEATMRQNYGQAANLASSFLDAVRAEAASTPDSGLRQGLNEALASRDGVISALAQADPRAVGILHGIELGLRTTLGYSAPTDPPTTPGP